MKKLIKSALLFLIAVVNICAVIFSVGYKYNSYKGTDFLRGENYSYVQKFRLSVNEYMAMYGDVVINNGELSVETNKYTRYVLKDESGINLFEVYFSNMDDSALEDMFYEYYAKVDVYKNNHNANSVSFALFGKTSFISYIYDPAQELKYTEYSSMIEGSFKTINNYSFKQKFMYYESSEESLNELLLSVGESKRVADRNNAMKKIAIYASVFYLFTIIILFVIKKKISYFDLLIIFGSTLVICIAPSLLIKKVEVEILLIISLLIGDVISLLFRRKKELDE